MVAFPEEKHDGGGATEDAFARRRFAYLIRRVVCAPLLVPFKVSIRAMRERNAGNHADKTSPRCSMGCRGRGESGGNRNKPQRIDVRSVTCHFFIMATEDSE